MSQIDWNTVIKYGNKKITEYKSKIRQPVNLSFEERDNTIKSLKDRIKRLEEDMAHILVNK